MGIVHSLQSDAGVIAVEVAVLDEVFDGVNDLHTLGASIERQGLPDLLESCCLI